MIGFELNIHGNLRTQIDVDKRISRKKSDKYQVKNLTLPVLIS
jgi:hypothetical protein